ncbi:hypothetical protein [Aureispira sp. CCB-E]|uniref:hypothetical protein n=1 Tax=Aureispira sp. CCB-E TaxID=3051121 RepID=UPI0028683CD0|nr:hypothetical protein [Aureispira sp. CCB-E]WMX16366.1 hypothetical protein QP953_08305 [Aureispira sp. CCB-E]
MKTPVILMLVLLFTVACQQVKTKSNSLLQKEEQHKIYPVHCSIKENQQEKVADKEKKYVQENLKLGATKDKEGVLVFWSIKENTQTEAFVVEKSYDKINFVPIGRIEDALQGASKHYSYIDHFPAKQRIYYRLKQLYKDGTYYNSPPKEVDIDNSSEGWLFVKSICQFSKLRVELALEMAQFPVEIELYNDLGAKIKSYIEHQSHSELMLPSLLQEGGTVRVITADRKVETQRF